MIKQRYITVPLDMEAVQEYDMGKENIKNSLTWILTEEEFTKLKDANIFNQINDACSVLIDDYESEVIQGNDLESAYNIIRVFYDKESSSIYAKLKNYIESAINKKTLIAFDF